MQKKSGKSSKSKSSSKKYDRSDYWKNYWQEKGSTILEKRKVRYRQDDGYKEEITKARKRSYERNRNIKYKIPKSVSFDKLRSFKMEHNGQECIVYDIKGCAACIGRSVSSLRYWERNNIVPKTPLRYQRRCVYTKEMILAIVEALSEQGFPGNVNLDDLSNHVFAAWQALNII